jgi:protein CMS1
MSIEDKLQEPLIERLSPTPGPNEHAKTLGSTKRKRETAQEPSSEKAAKRPKGKKTKVIDEDEFDTDLGINNSFSHMDNQLLADYVAQRTRQYEGDLSLVELEDKYIPGIINT